MLDLLVYRRVLLGNNFGEMGLSIFFFSSNDAPSHFPGVSIFPPPFSPSGEHSTPER